MINRVGKGKFRINGTYSAEELAIIIKENIGDYFTRPVTDKAFTSPDHAVNFFNSQLVFKEAEAFCVLFLDNRHRAISFDEMFNGTIDGASVHPREIVKRALKHNAAAVILAHNHPSGITDPSQADIALTKRLKESLSLVDVRVLDHFIVGEQTTSFSERGLI